MKEKRLLLVDDIYTTGSTLRHAAKLLKEAGATERSIVHTCTHRKGRINRPKLYFIFKAFWAFSISCPSKRPKSYAGYKPFCAYN